MMGRLKGDQSQLFYEFRLDEVVPADHLVRRIDAVLDLSWVHAELARHYPSIGRPSIDPELMIRMLIVGYVFAIRSERALCREVKVNLAYRWFCKLGIEDQIPDHSAFSRARNERFKESDIFRRVFERVVSACIGAGLVGGQGFAVDASLIVADANKQRSIPGKDWDKQRDPQTASRQARWRWRACACGAVLDAAGQDLAKEYDHIDIPPIRPVTTRIELFRATCPCCKARVTARAPADMPEGTPFGPGIASIVTYLHGCQMIGYKQLAEVCQGPQGTQVVQCGRQFAAEPALREAFATLERLRVDAVTQLTDVPGSIQNIIRVAQGNCGTPQEFFVGRTAQCVPRLGS